MAVRVPTHCAPSPLKERERMPCYGLNGSKSTSIYELGSPNGWKIIPLVPDRRRSVANWYEGLKDSDKGTFVTLENAFKLVQRVHRFG